ncbi:sensor domain-containing protein [Mycolicibacterium chitae]|uniref:Lipoprotein lpph n=1 Tax=Mycolicibacterium chitae TaxID=1792 RepID=A0A448I8V2_MYCCI|nr:sensor domain-containing protein [Mycolicibacterium chitae]MCV7105419.1 sensor domain-containing protein [Mycolicibacterium chitae]BBZ05233.1 sensor domain-containing protein [Mycolicibacterium chitae]VEG48852.1 lipoprotein lpph [Mycolicibacterium chitae]
MNAPIPGFAGHSDEKTVRIAPRGAHGHGPGPAPQPVAAPYWSARPQVPPWQPPPPRPAGRRTLWIALSASVALGAALIGTVVAVTGNDSDAPTPAPSVTPAAADTADDPSIPGDEADEIAPVPVAALSGLLLNLPEAAAVAGSATMAGSPLSGERIYEAMADEPYVDGDCASLSPGQLLAYRGSGFTASRQQFLAGETPQRKVVQTVVAFSDAAAAQNYVAAAAPKWRACENRTVNLGVVGGDPIFWAVAGVGESGGILAATKIEEGGGGWVCQDGLAARNNVVIDFAICGENVPESVVPAYVDKVADKIEGIGG